MTRLLIWKAFEDLLLGPVESFCISENTRLFFPGFYVVHIPEVREGPMPCYDLGEYDSLANVTVKKGREHLITIQGALNLPYPNAYWREIERAVTE
jgi:hypothetical protein